METENHNVDSVPPEKPVDSTPNLNDINVINEAGSPVNLPVPGDDELAAFREEIKNMDPEKRRALLQHLANQYRVNQEGKHFNPASGKDMLKERMRRKRDMMKQQRVPKSAQKSIREKRNQAMAKRQESLKQKGVPVSADDNDPLPDSGDQDDVSNLLKPVDASDIEHHHVHGPGCMHD